MVNLPPDLEGPVIARARGMNRSVANYIECLIAADVKASRSGEDPSSGSDLGGEVLELALKKRGR